MVCFTQMAGRIPRQAHWEVDTMLFKSVSAAALSAALALVVLFPSLGDAQYYHYPDRNLQPAAIPPTQQLSPPQITVLSLPAKISGRWVNLANQVWSNDWELSRFDLHAKTALASLGRGGDSCGFTNAPAIIKSWDGRSLVIEVLDQCQFKVPILFRLNRYGDRWEGSVENDVRTVSASGQTSG